MRKTILMLLAVISNSAMAEWAKSDQPDEILTIDEAAAYLKAGKRTVYRLGDSYEQLH